MPTAKTEKADLPVKAKAERNTSAGRFTKDVTSGGSPAGKRTMAGRPPGAQIKLLPGSIDKSYAAAVKRVESDYGVKVGDASRLQRRRTFTPEDFKAAVSAAGIVLQFGHPARAAAKKTSR